MNRNPRASAFVDFEQAVFERDGHAGVADRLFVGAGFAVRAEFRRACAARASAKGGGCGLAVFMMNGTKGFAFGFDVV
ncbi:MAG: hypothetical protein LBD68_04460, partial [Zoogloeaceae bacterium]|nr:hypothetical protein [Zoogloeaceae bacterium]